MGEKISGIYMIKNQVNGKKYIGQSVDIFDRNYHERRNMERGHIHASGKNKYFDRAIQKYGAESFTFSVLEECSADMLDEREIYYIKKYNTLAPNGYNLTKGGKSGTPGYKFTDEQKQKLSEIQKKLFADGKNTTAGRRGEENHMFGKPSPNRGKKRPREIVEKALRNRRSFRGANNPNYGKHAAEKTKAIWHEQRAGRKLSDEWKKRISDNSNMAKAVVCIDTGTIYRSCAEAAKSEGVKAPRNIGDAASGRLKTCGGKKWVWLAEAKCKQMTLEGVTAT